MIIDKVVKISQDTALTLSTPFFNGDTEVVPEKEAPTTEPGTQPVPLPKLPDGPFPGFEPSPDDPCTPSQCPVREGGR